MKKLTYASGFVVEYVYNDLELLEEIWYTKSGIRELAYEYEYTDKGQVHEFIDNLTEKSTVYKYDVNDRLVAFIECSNDDLYHDFSATVSYNAYNKNLNTISYRVSHINGTTIDDVNLWYLYSYNDDDSINYVSMRTDVTSGNEYYYYDEYNRVSSKVYNYCLRKASSTKFRNEVSYTYEVFGDYTSNRVAIHTSNINDGETLSSTFTYDANGNITKIVYSTGEEIRYVYDYLNRLIREDNGLKDYTYVYTYDKSGNILTKVSYALTAEGATPSNPRSTNTYTYATDGWGDRLTAYNGTAITYDDMGNPVSYSNGAGSYTFTWSGRQATTIQKGPLTYYLTYNDEGMRTSKTVNGVTTTYYVSGTQILAEETNGNVTVYLYDSEGAPLGMQYHGASYEANVWDVFWYERNIFGDVVAVYDEAGTLLISYTYDAYGLMSSMSHNNGYDTQAYYNPFRYRGYYYDRDLSLYYLSTRYYDCRTGRFVSPDDISVIGATPGALTDKNLYAYCDDNPIMRRDDGGEFWNYVIGGVVGAIAGGIVAAINGEDATGIIVGVLGGAASGVVAASGLGLIAQATISAGISATADFANQTIDIAQTGGNFANYDIKKTADEAALGFITSAAGTLLGGFLDKKFFGILGNSSKAYDRYLGKTFSAGLRQEVGKSTSKLIKQANTFLKQSDFYLNVYRGVSSVIGSGVSLWNIAR